MKALESQIGIKPTAEVVFITVHYQANADESLPDEKIPKFPSVKALLQNQTVEPNSAIITLQLNKNSEATSNNVENDIKVLTQLILVQTLM